MTTIEQPPNDQLFVDQFRIGQWPKFFGGVQFDRSSEMLNQFFRALTPNTGPAILFTHSQGGEPGWLTAIESPNVKAVLAFERQSGFIFPQGESPSEMPSAAGTLKAREIPADDFAKPTSMPDRDLFWRQHPNRTDRRARKGQLVRAPCDGTAMGRGRQPAWRDARLVHLPEIDISGNTHFLRSDLNNLEIADKVSKFLAEKKMD